MNALVAHLHPEDSANPAENGSKHPPVHSKPKKVTIFEKKTQKNLHENIKSQGLNYVPPRWGGRSARWHPSGVTFTTL